MAKEDHENGELKDKTLDSEIFHLKLTTLERRMDDNTQRVVEKLGEMVGELRLFRESILAAALEISPRHDGALMSIVSPIIKTLLWVVGLMVVWFTGLREVLPHFFR